MNRNSFFNKHDLNIDVILGRRKLSIKQLKNLHVDSVIELDKLAGEPLDVMIDNEFFALGEAVVIDENFGIRITELVDDEDTDSPSPAANSKKEELEEKNNVNTNSEIFSINQEKSISEEHTTNANDEKQSPENLKNREGHEVLSEEEIDQLLQAISEDEDYHPVTRKIKIYDFYHPVIFAKDTVGSIGSFMNKVCTIIPSIFSQQIVCKLDSITQIPYNECYKNINTTFIDQWKWYSSNNYVEISIDDFIVNQLLGLTKENEYYLKGELEHIQTEIAAPLAALLIKAVENYSDKSNIPVITHVNTAPCPDFVLTTPDDQECDWNCYIKHYADTNSSMYISCKIKIMSLAVKDSCGYLYINIPADDLKQYIKSEFYSQSDNTPYLDDIRINTYVSFGSTRRPISQIMDVGEGTIIELDRVGGEPVTLKANGVPIALGEIIVIDEWFGIRITEIL